MDARAVFEEFADGATMVFQSMHRYWAPLADYCRRLEVALGHPVQANAYITPPGAQGFGAHEDEHDVFVLQSHGSKAWKVHERHDLTPTRPPLIDATIEPGDSLYIPEGFPHSASTQEDASVHVTVGILALTRLDILKEAMKAIETDPELRRPLPLRFAEQETFIEEAGEILQATGNSLAGLEPEGLVDALRRKLLTTRQPVLRGQMHRLLALGQVGDNSVVRRREGSFCVLERVGDELSVLLGDRELRLPTRVEPALEILAGGDAVSVADVPGLDQSGRAVLVRRLITEGLLEVVD
jgi:uncharacterized RmlC-like cupin family protein